MSTIKATVSKEMPTTSEVINSTSEISNITYGFDTCTKAAEQDGYDLPVYGLDNGQFFIIHASALSCISLSFICVVGVLIASFILNRHKSFWNWSKSERFVVYLAICDGLFNVSHSLDHTHYLVTKGHVKPKGLCAFYGFMLAEFITSQNLIVNVIAISAFLMIYFRKDLNFGRFDYRLLVYTYGLPFTGACIAAGLGQFGPNGTFCYFDGKNGKIANILFTTVPLLLIIISNTIMYILTWYRINSEASRLRRSLRQKPQVAGASTRAAKVMTLFVAAFSIQWCSMVVYGAWQWFENVPPQALFQCVTTFSNLGGVFNMFMFIVVRRRLFGKGMVGTGKANPS